MHGDASTSSAPDASVATTTASAATRAYDFPGFTTSLTARGVSIAPAAGDWTWSMHLARIGRVGAMRDVTGVAPDLADARATYVHDAGWREWYLHAPAGIEQGFDVADKPRGDGELAVELDCAGLSADMASDGKTIALHDARGAAVLHYGELHTKDARGHDVPSRLALDAAHHIVLWIDDARAEYPLAIDPLVWSQQGKLQAPDAAGGDELGRSVAISGDTASSART